MKALRLVLGIFIALSMLGIILGPIFLFTAHSFQKEFDDFSKTGTKTTATIQSVYDNGNPRHTSHFVDITYDIKDASGKSNTVTAERVSIYFKAAENVSAGHQLEIYYKKNSPKEVLLKINHQPEYTALYKQSWWGWTITGCSLFFLLMIPVFKRMNK